MQINWQNTNILRNEYCAGLLDKQKIPYEFIQYFFLIAPQSKTGFFFKINNELFFTQKNKETNNKLKLKPVIFYCNKLYAFSHRLDSIKKN